MKKQVWAAFLLGLALPLGLMAALSRNEAEPLPSMPAAAEQTEEAVREEPDLLVLTQSGQVESMKTQDYLVGVLLAEMPASFPDEALKAQAVVARTYAARRQSSGKHAQGAVCLQADCCQGYRTEADFFQDGGTQADLEKIRTAVEQTQGQVLTYEGELIDATYFSASGGSTEAAVAVWGADVPYLQAVDSPGEASAYDTDVVYMTPEAFAKALDFESDGKPEQWISDVTETDGGGVDTITIRGVQYRGTELRRALALRSTDFEIELQDGEFQIVTHGFGHRVGMSQYGAKAMAEAGNDYQQILSHYYLDTELTLWD